MVAFFIFLGIMAGLAVLYAYTQWRRTRSHVRMQIARQVETRRLTLELDPLYQAAQDREHRRKMEWAQFQVQSYLQLHRAPQETYLIDMPPNVTVTALPSLKRASERPQDVPLLDAPAVAAPAQEWLLSQLEENSLVVSPGVRRSTGEVVKVSIVDVPHLKIIGATGFGKSCLAGAVLDQATQLNSPDVLQLALLDLEHKTSRLFENRPHVAELRIGNRLVTMVATDADEVAEHLGILKKELDRRAKLSEAELERQPVLLMYVEEMLSLGYEVVEPKLLKRMFADLTILAVRGRKYGMFLLACMQTDYSSEEMKVTQKMFRFRSAAAIDTTAAKAAGFMNAELIKQNFSTGKPGQFVVEYPSFSDIVVAPVFDVKRLVAAQSRIAEPENVIPLHSVKGPGKVVESSLKSDETTDEIRPEADFQDSIDYIEEVAALREKGWGKIAIVEKVWRVKAGGTQAYREACAAYEQIIDALEAREA